MPLSADLRERLLQWYPDTAVPPAEDVDMLWLERLAVSAGLGLPRIARLDGAGCLPEHAVLSRAGTGAFWDATRSFCHPMAGQWCCQGERIARIHPTAEGAVAVWLLAHAGELQAMSPSQEYSLGAAIGSVIADVEKGDVGHAPQP